MINAATLEISPRLLALVAALDEFKGAWQAIGRLEPERLTRLKRVATVESAGASTRIEGARLSDREVAQLLDGLDITTFDTRDEQEVAGYAETMELIFQSSQDIELSENHIKQLHRDLLRHSAKDEHHRGAYKQIENRVEARDAEGNTVGVVFETASPFDTPRLMTELVDWTCDQFERQELHPLLVIAVFVVVFLEVHPFQDGNGRLSRLLTALLLLRSGYAYVPYVSLESVIEHNKEHYYRALHDTQVTIRTASPNWQPWVEYFLETLNTHKKRLEQKLERERVLFGELPTLSVEILELAREHGRVTIAEATRVTGRSRNTIKSHVQALVAKELLVKHGAGRGTWYSTG